MQGPPPEDGAHYDPSLDQRGGFTVNSPGVLILNGPSRSGKSHCLNYVMWQKRKLVAYGEAFSESIHDARNLSFIPPQFKHPAYRPEKMRALIDIQQGYTLRTGRTPPLAFAILDDCISNPKQWHDPALVQACTQTSHLNLFVIISTQYPNRIPPAFREGAFQTAIFKLKGRRSKDAAFEAYGNDFENMAEFKRAVLDRLGEKRFAFYNYFASEGKEWGLFRCPATIPAFYLDYGSGARPHGRDETETGGRGGPAPFGDVGGPGPERKGRKRKRGGRAAVAQAGAGLHPH